MRGPQKTGNKSKRALDARTADPLYDFLYRDSDRLASYYAQIFGGRLTSSESITQQSLTSNMGAKANVAFAGADVSENKQELNSLKLISDPHDLMIREVLRHLHSAGAIKSDFALAKNGELVSATGRLIFFDSAILKQVVNVATLSVGAMSMEDPSEMRDAQIMQSHLIAMMASTLDMPSTFTLSVGKDLQMAGSLNPSGMQEPISSFHFKHGSHGLPNISVIGIKEASGVAPNMEVTEMMQAGQAFADALAAFLFTEDTIRVCPLAIFRQIA